MNKPLSWLLLITTLPTRNATVRMRVWRGLKALGCAMVRDGVYLAPRLPTLEKALADWAEEVTAEGGEARLLLAAVRESALDEESAMRALFDRSADYAVLLEEMASCSTDGIGEAQAMQKKLKKLRRHVESIRAIDFFPGAAEAHLTQRLSELESQWSARFFPGEPSASGNGVPRVRRADYQGRLWGTRRDLWVDRVSSAWLIRRFIDPQARFVWLERLEDLPPEGVGFDFDGATFTHLGGRVTFETLLAAFGLESDPALARLGNMVHFLDAGGVPAPEAAGFEQLLTGLRRANPGDDLLLERIAPILEALYESFKE
ncbi:MAG: chromate resistance protein [Magnetococcales bacterium]|nr:chromate resistance protein [Magnetococcales bacterium]